MISGVLTMDRISQKLGDLQNRKEKALVCFITAGFPKRNSTVPLVRAIEKGGADIIEIGMPFSDPLAEGPIIQHSSYVALKNGVTLDLILSQVIKIRKTSDIPIILMGYINPILCYGAEKFFRDASSAGVDGIILPELPVEESFRFRRLMKVCGLANIILVSPTTPLRRIKKIDQLSEGFLYCVSTTGVTGSRTSTKSGNYIQNVKSNAKKNAVLVGFGIKTPADAQAIARKADGVIIGSALISKIGEGTSIAGISNYVHKFKEGLRI